LCKFKVYWQPRQGNIIKDEQLKAMQVNLIHIEISDSPEKNLEITEQMLCRTANAGASAQSI